VKRLERGTLGVVVERMEGERIEKRIIERE
jgi:hypothetical protein